VDNASNDSAGNQGIGPLLSRHRKLIVAAVLLISGFSYFGFIAFQNATAYYLTVDELVARGPSLTAQSIQVKGTLVPESFVREGNGSTIAHFTLTEGGENLPATYDGVLPDLFFNSHSEIVLSGEYNQSGLFVTDRVLVKCPSKYQSEEYAEPNPSL
jgi:cytochrome c-type biogenesis protein CcmE